MTTRVLMPVFNEIDHDGRVERAAAAIGRHHPVTVYALDSGKAYTPQGFAAVRVGVPGLGRLRVLRPLLFWLGFLAFALRRRPDVVHAHDYYMAFPGWLAARLTGARFVYDAHELIIPSPGVPMRWSERVYYRLERLVARRADAIVAANARRAALMAEHYRLRQVPAVVRNIPLPEPEAAADDPGAAGLPELPPKPAGVFRLVYQGYLAERFHLDDYIRAVAAQGESVQMVMVGPGPAGPALAALAAELCPGRVFLLGRLPRRFLKTVLLSGDAGIIVYGTETLNELHCAPNKVFEYAQAGLPSIANANPGLREIVETAGIGVAGPDALDTLRRMMAGHARFKAALPGFLAANGWEAEAACLTALYDGLAR